MRIKANYKVCKREDCPAAGKPQHLSTFRKSPHGHRENVCKLCRSADHKKWYKENTAFGKGALKGGFNAGSFIPRKRAQQREA